MIHSSFVTNIAQSWLCLVNTEPRTVSVYQVSPRSGFVEDLPWSTAKSAPAQWAGDDRCGDKRGGGMSSNQENGESWVGSPT